MLKESLSRRAVLPWKGGELSFSENLQLMTVDEVGTIFLGAWNHLFYGFLEPFVWALGTICLPLEPFGQETRSSTYLCPARRGVSHVTWAWNHLPGRGAVTLDSFELFRWDSFEHSFELFR